MGGRAGGHQQQSITQGTTKRTRGWGIGERAQCQRTRCGGRRRAGAAGARASRRRGSGCQRLCIKNQSRKMVNSKFRHSHDAQRQCRAVQGHLECWPAVGGQQLAASSQQQQQQQQQQQKRNAPVSHLTAPRRQLPERCHAIVACGPRMHVEQRGAGRVSAGSGGGGGIGGRGGSWRQQQRRRESVGRVVRGYASRISPERWLIQNFVIPTSQSRASQAPFSCPRSAPGRPAARRRRRQWRRSSRRNRGGARRSRSSIARRTHLGSHAGPRYGCGGRAARALASALDRVVCGWLPLECSRLKKRVIA